MNPLAISITPIGYITSPHKTLENMPIQPKGAADAIGKIVLDEKYLPALQDLDGFSHIYIIYHFHKAPGTKLKVTPFMDDTQRGVFATRAPVRPSHIGMSVVELISVEGRTVTVKGIDTLDGTPLLDIKPYVEKFDRPESPVRSGWLEKSSPKQIESRRSDTRFTED